MSLLCCMKWGLYFKSYFGEGIFPFHGIERQGVHSPVSRHLPTNGPTLACWHNVPKSISTGQITGFYGPFNAVLKVALYLCWLLSKNTALLQLTARKPRGSSKSQLDFVWCYFPAIEARQQRKIKVNYYMLWVSETSFCFLPRSCTVLWFATAGSAPVFSW